MKDPAFLFYPNDWIGGTMGMTFEEKGAYFELLMLQFNRGHMTPQMIAQTVGQIWDRIKCKFIQDDEGLFYNERLELEKEKRKKFTESRRNNISGVNQYSKNVKKTNKKTENKKSHMTSHMENEIENEDVNENINEDGNIENNGLVKIEGALTSRFNFIDPLFEEPLQSWLQYKKSRQQSYKSIESIEICYNNLIELSGNNPVFARKIVNQSIANNWAGLFPLNSRNHGDDNHERTRQYIASRIAEEISNN